MSTQSGLDVLQRDPDAQQLVHGRRIGLITNHTGQTVDGVPTIKVLRSVGADVRVLFSPEHGPKGLQEGEIESSQSDEGLVIHSLYGATKRPTREMLSGLDALVFDIQDVGARFYTYSTTLAYCLEECAFHKIAMIVLDRPNPLGGEKIEGPMLEDECRSFIGHVNLPVVHGLTLGEIALYHVAQQSLDVELHVVKVENWNRSMRWPEIKLPWIAPSPNLPDFTSAAWYPSTCLLEFSNVSVGRGTQAPFQIVGAPWMNSDRVLEHTKQWPSFVKENVQLKKIDFTPARATHEGTTCEGIRVDSPDIKDVPLVALGLCLLHSLHQTHPEDFDEQQVQAARLLIGSQEILSFIKKDQLEEAFKRIQKDTEEFRTIRQKSFLY